MTDQVANQPSEAPLSVVAGTITASHVRVEMAAGVITCLDRQVVSEWFVQSCGPYLDMGRNKIVRRFLNHPDFMTDKTKPCTADFLYFWDSDVAAWPDDITQLVELAEKHHAEHDVWPVVGGCYQGVDTGGAHPIVYRWVNVPDDEKMPVQLHSLTNEEILEAETPITVDAIGTGSMLIHRSILENMNFGEPQPWFYEGPMGGDGPIAGQWFGEDLWFCFRAAAMGHPIIAHRGVRLVHYKDLGLPFVKE